MAYSNTMEARLNRPGHQCDVPGSHIFQHQESLQKIKRRFLVIKEGPSGLDARTLLCIRKEDIYTTLDDPKAAADSPEQNSSALQWLKSQTVIVKYPKCMRLEWGFAKEIFTTETAGSIKGTIGCRTFDGRPRPVMEMRWLRGGSLRDHASNLRTRSLPMPAEMIWHIAVSLLETVKGLRNGYPDVKPNEVPIFHGDIHLGNVMVDIRDSYFPPYPDIVLIDFGQGQVGRKGRFKDDLKMMVAQMKGDLVGIGYILHTLAHQRHLEGCLIKSWGYWPLQDGKCTCMQQADDAPFGDADASFAELMDGLCGPAAMDMNDAGLDRLLEVARRCREEQTLRVYGEVEKREFQPGLTDIGGRILSSDEIAMAMRKAYEEGVLTE